ncbi:hypothetical protein EPI10_027458 [Gossypium australe]|uniref:Uncharacterized protein n=1 Tax=Gossypium australe TaxID=47621 RepID=A0A5B6UV41_9ROSI|nr:hypothetical protein EPI10_027458 [Gossypium australe]
MKGLSNFQLPGVPTFHRQKTRRLVSPHLLKIHDTQRMYATDSQSKLYICGTYHLGPLFADTNWPSWEYSFVLSSIA